MRKFKIINYILRYLYNKKFKTPDMNREHNILINTKNKINF